MRLAMATERRVASWRSAGGHPGRVGIVRAVLLAGALALTGCAHHWQAREAIHPVPNRPYSQVVRVGPTYYFAGKIGVTDSTRALTAGRAAAETRNILAAFRSLFSELGLVPEDVVQGTVYLADINDYDEMNRAYAEFFPSDPPARECVAVSGIVSGARVEISFIAVKHGGR
jgi:2-iminobutanoate/2-iminopropanoate deaminase